VTGGHHPEGSPSDDGFGIPNVTLYDPVADAWSNSLPLMNDGRWYPTNTVLANGDMLVLSGSKDRSYVKNTLPQVWESVVQGWRNLTGAEEDVLNLTHLGVDLYPRTFQAPDGRVVKVGPDALTSFLDPSGTGQWFTGPSSSARRLYGSAVMYEAGKVLIVGGSASHDPGVFPIQAAEKIDLNDANPLWSGARSLAVGRKQLNATTLPDGRVLVTGGTSGDGFSNPAFAEFTAELWDPGTNAFATMAAMQVPRLYHSTAVLLPDGRVLSAGGGQGAFATRFHTEAEVYSPPYLFRGARPMITSAPGAVFLGESFFVETAEAPVIAKVSLIRLPSVTHAFDQNQRYVSLAFSQDAGGLRITAPPNSNLVPPGHYMLFIVDNGGVSSVARIIQIIAQS
jgi:galactose oxidase-like protein